MRLLLDQGLGLLLDYKLGLALDEELRLGLYHTEGGASSGSATEVSDRLV